MENTVSKKTSSKTKRRSPAAQVFRRLMKNKSSFIAFIFICLLVIASVCAGLIFDPDLVYTQNAMEAKQPPSAEHIFGTDIYGRDIFIRILFGARTSLAIGVITILVATTIGLLLGSISAYYGGVVDEIIMRIMDVMLAIPETLLAMCVVCVAGASPVSLIIALVLAIIPTRSRLVRSSVLGIVDREFIEAARAAGMSDFRIIVTQILPNSIGPVIVVSTQGVANMMLTAAGLSYMGLGIQPPSPEWGAIIAAAREYLRLHPYMCVIPGVVLAVTALAFNLLGDGLRDALDPRLKD